MLKLKFHKILYLAMTGVVCLLLLEAGIRSVFFVRNKINPPGRILSTEFGWVTRPNRHGREIVKGYGEIDFSTTKLGFRVFGDINTTKTKIFIIGDSFTCAETVSDGWTYYDYLRKNNDNVEIFACGTGGHGSLQEYMVMDKYLDLIKPDIILWQFCGNDFVNNEYEFEAKSIVNDFMVRPYYIDDKIQYLFPGQTSSWWCLVTKHSYLARFLSVRINLLKGRSEENVSGENHPLFKKSVITTSKIIRLVRKRSGNIPVIAFSSDMGYAKIVSDIFKNNNICFLPAIPEAVKEMKESGVIVDGSPWDRCHWNNTGHSIVGKEILDYLIKNDLVFI
ncbi:MAG: SGNH/GDSL hydrolase family protein [Candidatus Omnitrophica bacterium]|nr:SGNH/GDSL hydrolase family protein [Candidatus Omnitrophota bacterium]